MFSVFFSIDTLEDISTNFCKVHSSKINLICVNSVEKTISYRRNLLICHNLNKNEESFNIN